jgi:hypothetical protein
MPKFDIPLPTAEQQAWSARHDANPDRRNRTPDPMTLPSAGPRSMTDLERAALVVAASMRNGRTTGGTTRLVPGALSYVQRLRLQRATTVSKIGQVKAGFTR